MGHGSPWPAVSGLRAYDGGGVPDEPVIRSREGHGKRGLTMPRSALPRGALVVQEAPCVRRIDQRMDLEPGRNDVGPGVQVRMQHFVGGDVEQHRCAASDLGVDGADFSVVDQLLDPRPVALPRRGNA